MQMAEKYKLPKITLDDEAKQVMLKYKWPGNVRQLKNITEQMSVIAEKRVIDREEILAFGDGANDADMIRAAGIGAAMEVSVPEVRAAADILAGSNDEDGVARAIQRYIDLG